MGVPGAALLLPRLRPDQWAIVEHPARTKVITCGRRWGKSVLSGAVGLATASQGGKVLWMAPTYKNTRPIWRWAEAACAPLVRRGLVQLNRTERTVTFPNSRGFLGIYSADNDVAVRGDWFNLAILDEAARMQETTWTDVVQPALADADGDALLPSTPAGKNWYWEEFRRGAVQMDGEIAAFTAPSSDNPNPAIQRAAALAKERVPDAAYRQEWLAEFVAESTTVFDREWFGERRYDAHQQSYVHAAAARWISWDTALTDTEGAAYSACVVADLIPDRQYGYRFHVREVWRDKATFPYLVQQIRDIARRYDDRPGVLKAVLIEAKVSGFSAAQTLRETGEPWLARLIQPVPPKGSKTQRAELAAVYVKQGAVWLPHPSDAVRWLPAFEDELYRFPAGQYADQVDAFSQLVQYVSGYLSAGIRARQEAATRRALAAAQEVA